MTEFAKSVVSSRWFNRLIILTIILAGVLAGVETDEALVLQHKSLFRLLDGTVLAIFMVEIVLKMASFGRQPLRYFSEGWNVFDFSIVVVCLLPVSSQFVAVLRLARALRLLRLISALPKLQILVGALLKSLSSMGYVSLLLGLMFYIYAVAGVHFFGANDPQFFGSLATSLITLMRLITLDDWGKVFDTQYLGPWVNAEETVRAVGQAKPITAVIYFISFILLGTMIMLNLFIGIVMNSMSEMHSEVADRKRTELEHATGPVSVSAQLALMDRQVEILRKQMENLRHSVDRQSQEKQGEGRESVKV